MSNNIKLDKVYKILETTENDDEKNLILQYLAKKMPDNFTLTNINKIKDKIKDTDKIKDKIKDKNIKELNEKELNEKELKVLKLLESEDILGLKEIIKKYKIRWELYIFSKA